MATRVWKKPTLITALTHNATFATDEVINEHLTTLYRNYDYLTDSDTANTAFLQSVIESWVNRCNELYATKLLEYDPMLNYDMRESGAIIDELHKGTKESQSVDVTVEDTPRVGRVTEQDGYGFDAGVNGVPMGKTIENAPTGTDTRHTTGNANNNVKTIEDISATKFDKNVHTFEEYRKYGNLGVVKPQDMIEAERRIIIDVLEIYCEKFAVCFKISDRIAFEPFEDESEEEGE